MRPHPGGAAQHTGQASPLRILHIIPQFPWFGGRTVVGGYSVCLLTLAAEQAARGDEVTILSYLRGKPGSTPIEPRLRVVSLFDEASPGTPAYGLRFYRAVGAWAKAHRGEFDLIHGHSGFADYIPVSAMAQRKSGLPAMHTLYCPIPAQGGRWNLPVVRSVIRRSAERLGAMTGMSAHVTDSLVSFGISRDFAQVTHPAVDLERFNTSSDGSAELRQRLGIDPDDVMVLFVGNAKPQKNMSGLLDAVAAVRETNPKVRLVVTTELKQSSTDERMQELSEQMERLGLVESTVQLGIIDDMPQLLRACDILAAPFLDSFGPSDYFMAVLEAMASGKPTVVSDVGGMSEVITPENGRLIDPKREGSIADALGELAPDTALRERLGRSARDTMERMCLPDLVLSGFDTIYEKVRASCRKK